MLAKILGLLFGIGGNVASKVIGTAGTVAAMTGVVAWLFGPGREITLCLNALELSGVALGAQLILQWILRLAPPRAAVISREIEPGP